MIKGKKSGYLYLSTLVPDSEFNKEIKRDLNPQMATHIFNWKLYKGIRYSSYLKDYDFYTISTRPITEYPSNTTKIVKSKTWQTEHGELHEIFFFNYPVLKTVSILISCLCYCINWCISNKKKKGVFIDSYQLPYLICGFLVSRLFQIPLIGVLTDPPNIPYNISFENNFKSKFRKLNGFLSRYIIKRFSGAIVLTKQLAEDYCPEKRNIVIEAISDEIELEHNITIQDINSQINGNFIILYSGSLSKVYGLLTLIEAFTKLTYENMELWLFGKGDIEEDIKRAAKKDKRIRYWGFMDNSKTKYYQSIATLLVNPRPTDLPDANYSFPSKLLEYMQSGTPTLTTRLKGIPNEYDDFMLYFDDYSEYCILNRINEIYNMDRNYIANFGIRAKCFATSKNIKNQGDKMARFILETTYRNN